MGSGTLRSFVALLAGAVLLLAPVAGASPDRTLPGAVQGDFVSDGTEVQTVYTGGHKRIVLLCRMLNPPSGSTKNLAFYEALWQRQNAGLLAYFDEASYGRLNVTVKFRDWVDMPKNQSDYFNDGNGSNVLFQDCMNAHDPTVDYSKFDAIDMIINDSFGPAHLGGTKCTGIAVCYAYTMIASSNGDEADNLALYAHEIAHSLDLPHTVGTADASHYWDPLSAPGLWCLFFGEHDPNYQCTPVHYLAAHKDAYTTMVNTPCCGKFKTTFGLGWIPKDRRYVAKKGESEKVTIERLARPRNNDNFLIARIPIPGKRPYYTVESRIRVGNFDSANNLPGDGVLISHVDWKCNNSQCPGYTPVQVVGKDKNGDFRVDPESAMWKPGEKFKDGANGIKVEVLHKNGDNAYRVRITVED